MTSVFFVCVALASLLLNVYGNESSEEDQDDDALWVLDEATGRNVEFVCPSYFRNITFADLIRFVTEKKCDIPRDCDQSRQQCCIRVEREAKKRCSDRIPKDYFTATTTTTTTTPTPPPRKVITKYCPTKYFPRFDFKSMEPWKTEKSCKEREDCGEKECCCIMNQEKNDKLCYKYYTQFADEL